MLKNLGVQASHTLLSRAQATGAQELAGWSGTRLDELVKINLTIAILVNLADHRVELLLVWLQPERFHE